MNRLAKPLSIVFVVLSFYAIRLLVLPGLSFNQSVWDDEIGWIKDSNNKSVGMTNSQNFIYEKNNNQRNSYSNILKPKTAQNMDNMKIV